jgi:geranylgeranyl pyrophosphate synthase
MGEPLHPEAERELFADDIASLCRQAWRLLEQVPAPLRADVVLAFRQPGKLLSWEEAGQARERSERESGDLLAGRWALLTLLVARSLRPEIDEGYAGGVALAVESLVCAIDIFDDLSDGDQTLLIRQLGMGRALNVAAALLMLSQEAILMANSGAGEATAPTGALLAALQQATLCCLAGQQRDLLAESLPLAGYPYEDCLALAAAKAGSLMSLACRLGAISAGAPAELTERFATLGELLGIAGQLDNDCHDLYDLLLGLPSPATGGAQKSDLARGKKTLPLVLAGAAGVLPPVEASSHAEPAALPVPLQEALTAAWSISLLYRERARACLESIAAVQPLLPALRRLLGL